MKITLLLFAALAWGQEVAKPGINAETTSLPKQPSAEQQQVAALKQENAQLREALRVLGERHDKIAMSLNGCLGPLPQVPAAKPVPER